MTDLVTRLRNAANDYTISMYVEAADRIEALTAENARLRTVMVAAAEEIQAHWDAHCDAEGYGPANLMRRLEEGIPSQYGYTAGRFAELEAERDRLREELERARCAVQFAGKVLGFHRSHDCCDLDGRDVQEWAVEYGLLGEVDVAEPCGDFCMCAEYYDTFPAKCLRTTETGKSAIDAARKPG